MENIIVELTPLQAEAVSYLLESVMDEIDYAETKNIKDFIHEHKNDYTQYHQVHELLDSELKNQIR